jgi:transcriptional regulatory protein RtcR
MKTVVIGLLGTDRDSIKSKWSPTKSLCEQMNLTIDRFELLVQTGFQNVATELKEEIQSVSPNIKVNFYDVNFANGPWDFETVYRELRGFASDYPFDMDNEQYLIHISTGTHVARICLFLLCQSRYLPGKLIQSISSVYSPSKTGEHRIIDLDLSNYDQIAKHFVNEHLEGTEFLKDDIKIVNPAYNEMINEIEKISIRSKYPILLTGPTGSGKSKLANRIYDLKRQRNQISGKFVPVNCATLRGDHAMSALFGHSKGAFSGALAKRDGCLKRADKGLLFLDEIGELGLEEQAMLLKAIEEKKFTPLGADEETESEFQLIAGTNRNLREEVKQGNFRDDLLSRIDLWSYELPSLKDRMEDLEANIDHELKRYSEKNETRTIFNKEAFKYYLEFSKSPNALWKSNFRDLNASIIRMATLAEGGRITLEIVEKETRRLRNNWSQANDQDATSIENLLEKPTDLFDRLQLANVATICQKSKSAADAGRKLFDISRLDKTSKFNDTQRLSNFLKKFDLKFEQVKNWQK